MKSKTLLSPILASLFAFVLAAFLGLALRWAFVLDMPEWFNYRNIQHAHSHVALLGWLFGIICLSIIHYLDLDYSNYSTLYWSLQCAVLGMLVTFPIVGYAPLSIAFSTGHIILSYLFVYKLWRDIGTSQKGEFHILFVKTSLIFMVLSTIGTWAVGPIMMIGMKGTALYYGAIQFYLHFQFNGWFIFAIIGIALAMMHKHDIAIRWKSLHLFYWLLLISTVLSFALAISWSTPHWSIFIVNSIGVVLQLLALIVFLRFIFDHQSELTKVFSIYAFRVFRIALLAWIIKVVIQAIVVIPYMAEVSYSIRNFVIGFIHLLMLGCLSLFAFGSISEIVKRELSHLGTSIFLFGVVSTEILLFTQGLMVWQGWGFMPNYYLLLGLCSGFILLGVIIIVLNLCRLRSERV